MKTFDYRRILGVVSYRDASQRQCWILPEPNVLGVYENTRMEGIDTMSIMQIEPRCWKAMFLGDSYQCAPLEVKTDANTRPQINPVTEDAISSDFFQGDTNRQTLTETLLRTVNDLVERFNGMSREQFSTKQASSASVTYWTYKFPEDFYQRLNLVRNDNNRQLVQWLQRECVSGKRFVLPMTMSLVDAQNNKVADVKDAGFNLEILPQTGLVGTVIVLDCGTSSCYGAFTHSILIGKAATATPQEQALRRCQETKRWLQDPKFEYRSVLNEVLLDVLDALEPNSPDKGKGDFATLCKRLRAPNAQYLDVGGIFKFTREFERQLKAQCSLLIMGNSRTLNENQRYRREAYLAIIKKLNEIEKQTYETFSESSKNIQSAKLNQNTVGNDKTIVSEFTYKEDGCLTPDGVLGTVDPATRREKTWKEYCRRYGIGDVSRNETSQTGVVTNQTNEDDQYYRNPKSLIYSIHRDPSAARVYQGFLNSALQKAIKEYRAKGWSGDFAPNLALTYPATLSPMGRRKLRELAMQLGFPAVDVACDESVAPAIFYVEKFCGSAPELGLEDFKTLCTPDGDVWRHNMLILDCGAGTVDVSLVQFVLEEEKPSAPSIPGGRSYRITPYLLAAQGNPYMGGNYLTLLLFHYLRAFIALKTDNTGNSQLQSQKLQDLEDCPDLVTHMLSESLTQISEFAKKLLPTQYMEENLTHEEFDARYSRFNAIWDVAEKIKIHMSKAQKKNDGVVQDLNLEEFLDEKFFQDVLPESQNINAQGWFLRGVVFDSLQKAVVDQIVDKLAVGLVKEGLEVRKEKLNAKRESTSGTTFANEDDPVGLHSIILSGCASRLPKLEKYLKKTIVDSASGVNGAHRPFATSHTVFRFEDEYAKSATALGAANVWNNTYNKIKNVDQSPLVQNGFCTSTINVRNLAFYLSSSYVDASNQQTIFKLQSKFARCGLGAEEQYSILSDKWLGYATFFTISKQVGDAIGLPDYAQFGFNGFVNKVVACSQRDNNSDVMNACDPDFLLARFEIDLEQDVYVLVGRAKEVNATEPYFRYTTKIRGIRDEASYLDYGFQQDLPADWLDSQNAVVSLKGVVALEEVGDLFTNGAVVKYDCFDFDKKKKLVCCWSEKDFQLFANRAHTITLQFQCDPNATDAVPEQAQRNSVVFNLDKYYQDMIRYGVSSDELEELRAKIMITVELDDNGKPDPTKARAHIFVGDKPAYAETEDIQEWLNTPGLIYREKITNPNSFFDAKFDPFSGRQ